MGSFGSGGTQSAAAPTPNFITTPHATSSSRSAPTPPSAATPPDAATPPSVARRSSAQDTPQSQVDLMDVSVPSAQDPPKSQSMRQSPRKTLRQKAQELKEEENKPTGPPSPFSRKAQGGSRRGMQFYFFISCI